MPKRKTRKRKARKKPEAVHEYVSIRIDHYEVKSTASINSDVYAPEYAFNLDLDDPLYEFQTKLTITGTGIDPKDRAGHSFEITIYADDAPSKGLNLMLKDIQERCEYNSPKYRTYRKKEIPVFKQVSGMALLDKVRGENRWTAWINAAPRAITDMLLVLKEERTRYLSIHAVKESRTRWVRSISVQTTDPVEE